MKNKKEINKSLKLAQKGDVQAQYDLGRHYKDLASKEKYKDNKEKINLSFVEKNNNESANWFLMAAEQGFPDAQAEIAFNYFITKNERLAKKWSKKASKQGNKLGQVVLGQLVIKNDPDQGFDLIKKSAEQGQALGIYELARCYFNGVGTKKNYDEGLRWAKSFAKIRKKPRHMRTVGDLILPHNKKEALKWYKKAGEEGGPETHFKLAYLYIYGPVVKQDLKKAAEWLKKAEKTNDPELLLKIARIRLSIITNGLTNEKKIEEKIKIGKEYLDALKKSSKYGNAKAMYMLARAMEIGSGWFIKEDQKEAMKWYKLASDKGHSEARKEMGFYLYDGKIKDGDRKEGLRLVSLAAEQGDKRAQLTLADGYAFGHSGLLEINTEKAFFWAKKAVKEKDPSWSGVTNDPRITTVDPYLKIAQSFLAGCYADGRGVKKNNKLAFKYFMLAAKGGYSRAQYLVSRFYFQGYGIKKDFKKAFTWAEQAASDNEIRNITDPLNEDDKWFGQQDHWLGCLYHDGIGTDVSYENACKYFKISAENGHHRSQVLLANLFAGGLGVKKNTKQALYWLEKASEASELGADIRSAYLCREEEGKVKDYLTKEVENIFSKSNIFEIAGSWGLITKDEAAWVKELVDSGKPVVAFTFSGQLLLAESNQREAYRQFSNGAGLNDVVAKFYLAMFYRYGRVVSKNLSKAKTLLTEVTDAINSNPLKNLEMAKTAMKQDQVSQFASKYFTESKELRIFEEKLRYENDINYSSGFLMALEKQAQEIISSIEVMHEKEKTQKEVLSYLTHTINSAFGATQENLNQTIRILKSEYEKGTPQYKAINNVVSLSSTFSVINNLVQTFKIYINDPKVFKDAWVKDNEGEGDQIKVLAFSVRLVIAHILFQFPAHKVNGLARNKSEFNLKSLRKDFINEILLLELNTDRKQHGDKQNSKEVLQWVEKNFNFSFKFDENKLFRFEEFGIRFNFLMSIATEIILNSVKYSKPNLPIEICWEYDFHKFIFQCSNFIDTDSEGKFLGAGRGLDFIKELVGNLGNSNLRIANKAQDKFEAILKIKNI